MDKAQKNIAVICKKYYVECLHNELSIQQEAEGNSTYRIVSETEDEIVEKHALLWEERNYPTFQTPTQREDTTTRPNTKGALERGLVVQRAEAL